MNPEDYNIKELSDSLYKLVESISTFEAKYNQYKQRQDEPKHTDSDEAVINRILPKCNLEKNKIMGLIIAFQIDITICLKHMKNSSCRYESFFFFNIGLMKMNEIAKKILKIHQNIDHELYYKCPDNVRKNIISLVQEWNKKYNKWISEIRNFSVAHYDNNITKYIDYGYKNIDPTKNQECFSEFIFLLKYIEKYLMSNNINH